ncbi:ArsR/SmtB family transcription factor [Natronomonas sp. EA1]|uniref:ArsR/SmtB family transcription factor n=1 Tax=Natronomonas sp. EA1 TaxID=3421655 RepID=UPI003EBAAE0D
MESGAVLTVLGNKYAPEILAATAEPRSVQSIADELGVPVATCYRRVNELADAGLVELHERALSDERRRVSLYRRTVDEITVDFGETGIDVDIETRGEVKSRIDSVWRMLSDRSN